MLRIFSVLAALSTLLPTTTADPTDWVNVQYFASKSSTYRSGQTTARNAEQAVVQGAASASKRAPFSIRNGKGVTAPSGDPYDYLSWGPYHWPNCNWCGGGRTYYSDDPGNSTDSDPDSQPDKAQPDYQTGDSETDSDDYSGQAIAQAPEQYLGLPLRRMVRIKRQSTDSTVAAPLPTSLYSGLSSTVAVITSSSPTTTYPATGTQPPAQAAAKKQKESKPSSCTPSPTTSMAPSATWTTCPYVIRDGKVNPDVRTLHGPGAINDFSQASIYNAVAFAITKTPSYLDSLVKAIGTFYLDDSTKMNPNMDYGQVSRGPGPSGKQGSWAGILDGRGHVKSVNALLILKTSKHPSWTSKLDQAMMKWMSAYNTWLSTSALGKKALSRSNNHGTFFAIQLVATRLAVDDSSGAKEALQHFFDNAYSDQIAASGEQPFEAVRTRPFHYRCFNLEALITAAKMGEELGLDFWSKKTKRGSTIQTALDFTMQINPKQEDIRQIIPHVVSISRAYGDPTGKYAAFLNKAMPNYRDKTFWLYNQAPAPRKSSKRGVVYRRDGEWSEAPLPFECPSVFDASSEVELDPGLFVTCDELKPFFLSSKVLEGSAS